MATSRYNKNKEDDDEKNGITKGNKQGERVRHGLLHINIKAAPLLIAPTRLLNCIFMILVYLVARIMILLQKK